MNFALPSLQPSCQPINIQHTFTSSTLSVAQSEFPSPSVSGIGENPVQPETRMWTGTFAAPKIPHKALFKRLFTKSEAGSESLELVQIFA